MALELEDLVRGRPTGRGLTCTAILCAHRETRERFVLKVSSPDVDVDVANEGLVAAAGLLGGAAPELITLELRARTHDDAEAWVRVLSRRQALEQAPYTTSLYDMLGMSESDSAADAP